MDVLIATFVFIIIFILFFGILHNISESERDKRVKEEGEMLAEVVTVNSQIGFVKANKLDTGRLQNVKNMNYSDIKRGLDLRNDFCIYFEDENGELITIKDEDGTPITGSIGSADAKIGGIPCGS